MKELHPDKEIYYIGDFDRIADFIKSNAASGDMVITMGAGDVYKVGELILN